MRLFVATLILCTTPTISVAQNQCGPVADVLAGLATNYAEAPRVTAYMTGGNMLIVTVAPSGGWTALEVKPGGEACMVSAGEAFEVMALPAPGDPA